MEKQVATGGKDQEADSGGGDEGANHRVRNALSSSSSAAAAFAIAAVTEPVSSIGTRSMDTGTRTVLHGTDSASTGTAASASVNASASASGTGTGASQAQYDQQVVGVGRRRSLGAAGLYSNEVEADMQGQRTRRRVVAGVDMGVDSVVDSGNGIANGNGVGGQFGQRALDTGNASAVGDLSGMSQSSMEHSGPAQSEPAPAQQQEPQEPTNPVASESALIHEVRLSPYVSMRIEVDEMALNPPDHRASLDDRQQSPADSVMNASEAQAASGTSGRRTVIVRAPASRPQSLPPWQSGSLSTGVAAADDAGQRPSNYVAFPSRNSGRDGLITLLGGRLGARDMVDEEESPRRRYNPRNVFAVNIPPHGDGRDEIIDFGEILDAAEGGTDDDDDGGDGDNDHDINDVPGPTNAAVYVDDGPEYLFRSSDSSSEDDDDGDSDSDDDDTENNDDDANEDHEVDGEEGTDNEHDVSDSEQSTENEGTVVVGDEEDDDEERYVLNAPPPMEDEPLVVGLERFNIPQGQNLTARHQDSQPAAIDLAATDNRPPRSERAGRRTLADLIGDFPDDESPTVLRRRLNEAIRGTLYGHDFPGPATSRSPVDQPRVGPGNASHNDLSMPLTQAPDPSPRIARSSNVFVHSSDYSPGMQLTDSMHVLPRRHVFSIPPSVRRLDMLPSTNPDRETALGRSNGPAEASAIAIPNSRFVPGRSSPVDLAAFAMNQDSSNMVAARIAPSVPDPPSRGNQSEPPRNGERALVMGDPRQRFARHPAFFNRDAYLNAENADIDSDEDDILLIPGRFVQTNRNDRELVFSSMLNHGLNRVVGASAGDQLDVESRAVLNALGYYGLVLYTSLKNWGPEELKVTSDTRFLPNITYYFFNTCAILPDEKEISVPGEIAGAATGSLASQRGSPGIASLDPSLSLESTRSWETRARQLVDRIRLATSTVISRLEEGLELGASAYENPTANGSQDALATKHRVMDTVGLRLKQQRDYLDRAPDSSIVTKMEPLKKLLDAFPTFSCTAAAIDGHSPFGSLREKVVIGIVLDMFAHYYVMTEAPLFTVYRTIILPLQRKLYTSMGVSQFQMVHDRIDSILNSVQVRFGMRRRLLYRGGTAVLGRQMRFVMPQFDTMEEYISYYGSLERDLANQMGGLEISSLIN